MCEEPTAVNALSQFPPYEAARKCKAPFVERGLIDSGKMLETYAASYLLARAMAATHREG